MHYLILERFRFDRNCESALFKWDVAPRRPSRGWFASAVQTPLDRFPERIEHLIRPLDHRHVPAGIEENRSGGWNRVRQIPYGTGRSHPIFPPQHQKDGTANA